MARRLPLLLGVVFAGLGLGADRLGFGGQAGLGVTQRLLVEVGTILALGNLLVLPRLSGQIGSVLAAAIAALSVASGFGVDGIYLGAGGLALFATALYADLITGRRVLSAWRVSRRLEIRNLGWFALVALQVLTLVFVIREFHLENQAFYACVLPIVVSAFLLGYLVPAGNRLLFFGLLSAGVFWAVLGLSLFSGVALAGSFLIGLARLPVPFRVRAGLLIVAGSVMALAATNVVSLPLPRVVWPILGSLFMFRLIIYMYELKRARLTFGWKETLAYFFMFPNVVFLFFPVVDYSTFLKSHYDDDEHRIHQAGVRFMLIGISHLILYRVVQYYLVIPPDQVHTRVDMGRYVLTTFLLYLRVSGQFHVIVGLLHLFGFHLPETNNKYYLASSFTDLWRRMNIYWKDFMTKVFYYPILFKLAKHGTLVSLVIATASVFAITWLLHAYQWFWLRGSFLWTPQDMLFWAILGLLCVVTSIHEYRERQIQMASGWSPPRFALLRRALGTALTFTTMALLWSLWSSASLSEWVSLWSAFRPGARDLGFLSLLVFLGAAIGGGSRAPGGLAGASASSPGSSGSGQKLLRSIAGTAPLILLLFGIGHPAVYPRLGKTASTVVRQLRWERLPNQDQVHVERGYYENLNAAGSANAQLWNIYMRRPIYVPIWETDAVRQTGDYLKMELNPNVDLIFRGTAYRTNRWGMRDQDYEKSRPPGTFRIALLGDSHVEGWGVGNEENFDHLLETRLNRDHPETAFERYELLNFAVGGYLPVQVMMSLERKALPFAPQAILFFAHPGDVERVQYHLAEMAIAGRENPYPVLETLTREAGVGPGVELLTAVTRLASRGDSALTWVHRQTVEVCKRNGIVPVCVYLPSVPGRSDPSEHERIVAHAREAGFIIFDLADVYDGHELEEIRIAEWDQHPTPKGYRIIADRLYEEILRHPEMFSAEK